MVSFIGGGNRSTRRKPLTCRKSLTNFITYYCIEYTSPERDSKIHSEDNDSHHCVYKSVIMPVNIKYTMWYPVKLYLIPATKL